MNNEMQGSWMNLPAAHVEPHTDWSVAHDPRILAVGDGYFSSMMGLVDRDGEATAFADYSEVTPALVGTLKPEVVVSSVLGRTFDCVDLAEKLAAMGFEGCYRLIACGLPRPELVLRELRGLFPMLKVELEETPA